MCESVGQLKFEGQITWETAEQRKESFRKHSVPVAQFDSSQKPFVAYGKVPTRVVQVFGLAGRFQPKRK